MNSATRRIAWLSRLLGIFIFIGFMVCVPAFAASPSVAAEGSAEKNVDLGWTAFGQGNFERAISHWLEATRAYQQANQVREQVEALTYLAQAYQNLGQYKNSLKSLALALVLAEKSRNPMLTATVWGELGKLHIATGPATKARQYLNDGLKMAREAENRRLAGSILNNLGTLLVSQAQYAAGLDAYFESANIGKDLGNQSMAATALINAARAYLKIDQHDKALETLEGGLRSANDLSAASEKVLVLINIGELLRQLSHQLAAKKEGLLLRAAAILRQSQSIAETIGDRRGQSYALGNLAKLYEDERRYDEALQLTRRAVFFAQQINSPESLYRWQWQSGRLFKAVGNIDEAVSAYRRAIQTLQSVRQEMAIGYGNTGSSFRESIGPVYFELVDLLLQHPAVIAKQEQGKSLLLEARNTVELVKAAELRDYFRDDCVDAAYARSTKLDVVTNKAMVIYPIILPDRLELLLSLPAGLQKVAVPVNAEDLKSAVTEFRWTLEREQRQDFLPYAQKLYDWLIRPIESQWRSANIDTLVFVPDGALRTIPMAALHDGKQFLIDKIAVAVTPGLDLTDPQPLKRDKVKMLALGISESVQGYVALPNVTTELNAIQRIYGNNPIMNREFIASRVEKELKDNQFNVVHIASHGEVSSDAGQSFILTFDDKLTMDRLDQYLGLFRFADEPLELLTLSACETAAGDERAALGLAGIAVKAGARSALATLWKIQDEAASTLIREFYEQLQNPAVSRASALRRAQLKLLGDKRYEHPYFWAAFLLINNWL